jgi:rod shape-determining protein MreC
MESFFSRYRNEWVLVGILFAQIIALATQVRVPARSAEGSGEGSTRLLRVWAAGLMYPFQKLAVSTGGGVRGLWADYIDLRKVRDQNEQLRRELDQERLQRIAVQQDAEQGRRLQVLLDFKQRTIHKTVAAQVIGTSGTDLARVIYLDRGVRSGIRANMPVITPDGIVGKVSRADQFTSQVLLINDPQSGAGVLLERLRLHGILKGSSLGKPEVLNIMADEAIAEGDRIVTTGGDRVFPKGLPVGVVESLSKDPEREPFLTIKVKSAVNLGKLEEVLVITEMIEAAPEGIPAETKRIRAADLLADRLPSVPKKPVEEKKVVAGGVRKRARTETVPAQVKPGNEVAPENQGSTALMPSASPVAPGQQPAPASPQAQSPPPQPPAEDRPR